MKVLIWGNKIFSYDVMWGFMQVGCDAQVILADREDQMRSILSEEKPDLLLSLGAPIELRKGVLEYIGKRTPSSMKYIHWDTDGISSRYYQSVSGDGIEMDVIYLSKPDLVLTICPEMKRFVENKKYPCAMMHYGYSPLFHRPDDMKKKDNNAICLIGNSYIGIYPYHTDHYRYMSLNILLKPLLENGFHVHIYGDTGYRSLIKMLYNIDLPEEYCHGYLPYEQTCEAYRNAFINLVTQNHDLTITKRTFEILASGGFALSSDNSAIRKLFTPGRDLTVSSSPEKTLELVRYYQDHHDAWQEVRNNATLSVKDHSYKQRAEYILRLMKKYWP